MFDEHSHAPLGAGYRERMCAVCFTAVQVVPLGALYARARYVKARDGRDGAAVVAEAEATISRSPAPTADDPRTTR